MANVKHGAKARRILAEKENIANIAKWLLVAFCLQFIFYLGLINLIPLTDKETGELNSLYSENWINYKGSEGNLHTEGNGIKFIYGYNMVLLVCATGLVLYYAMVFMEEYEGIVVLKAKEFFKEHKGLMFLVLFMIWTFISSCLAYDKFRSFIGCYNLRDGFFSFSFYGSILVLILLMSISDFEGKVKKLFGKIEINPKRLIVDIFLVVMTIIALITLGDYSTLNYNADFKMYEGWYVKIADGTTSGESIGLSIEPKISQNMTAKNGLPAVVTVPRATTTSVTSSVFNNSNHYAYVLSIAVVVAAVMFIKTKSMSRIGYLVSFVLLTVMLIINDTFGAYLGIMIALMLMFIHAIITVSKEPEQFFGICINIILFIVLSITIRNTSNEIIVKKNFDYISQSISDILGVENKEKEVEKQLVSISGEQYIVEEVTKETVEEKKDLSNVDAGDAGSGRWKLWVGAWEIIKDKPIFGAGLENMIYEYSKLNIGEGRSHNLILQLAGTVGIPGMLLYVLGVTFIFFKALKYFKVWDTYTYMGMFVMVSYLISSLTGNSGFYTSGYFYIFVGFVVVGTIALERSKDKNEKLLPKPQKEKDVIEVTDKKWRKAN